MIHRLDPRVKLAMLGWAFLAASLANDIVSLSVICLLLLAGFIVTESTGNILKMGWMLLLIGVMTFLLWMLLPGSAPEKEIAAAESPPRFLQALVMAFRFVAMLLSGVFFLSVTSPGEFTSGLMLLKAPYPAAFAVSLSFRLVDSFISTGFLIVEAQEVRGNDATAGNILKRIKAYAPLLVPLILNGIKKAETLTLALESKGFSPLNKPDIPGRYKLNNTDAAALWLLAATAVIMILYRIFMR